MTTPSERLDVPPFVLLCAFRYALGRHTAAVDLVASSLRRHRDAVPRGWLTQVVSEIELAIHLGEAGEKAEVETWRDTATVLRQVIA